MADFMTLLDRLIENRDPGPTGSVNFVEPLPYVGSARVLTARAALGVAMLGGGAFLAYRSDKQPLAFAALIAYLVISFSIVPQADTDNLGYLGYQNRPLRFADWANRYLFVFRLMLWPGRFALSTIRDAYWHARGKKSIVLYRTVEYSPPDDDTP